METIRNICIGVVSIVLVALGAMKIGGFGLFKTEPSEELIKAVTNVEQIHFLVDQDEIDCDLVPELCKDALEMAGKDSENEILLKAVEEACQFATPGTKAKPNAKHQYTEMEGNREIYELAAIRMGFKDNDGNLYRTEISDIATWQRNDIENVGIDNIQNWFKRHHFKGWVLIFIILALIGAVAGNSDDAAEVIIRRRRK